jgi:hypothetical protein
VVGRQDSFFNLFFRFCRTKDMQQPEDDERSPENERRRCLICGEVVPSALALDHVPACYLRSCERSGVAPLFACGRAAHEKQPTVGDKRASAKVRNPDPKRQTPIAKMLGHPSEEPAAEGREAQCAGIEREAKPARQEPPSSNRHQTIDDLETG